MGRKSNGDIVEKKTKKELNFDLTKAEREAKLEKLLALEKDIGNKKAQITKFRTEVMAEIKESTVERVKLARHLDDNSEPRVVECIARFDYASGRVSFVHKGKVMEDRQIWEHEKQESLPLEQPSKAAPKKKKAKKNATTPDVNLNDGSDIPSDFGASALAPANA